MVFNWVSNNFFLVFFILFIYFKMQVSFWKVLIITITTVSYTHLDVYKRQLLYCACWNFIITNKHCFNICCLNILITIKFNVLFTSFLLNMIWRLYKYFRKMSIQLFLNIFLRSYVCIRIVQLQKHFSWTVSSLKREQVFECFIFSNVLSFKIMTCLKHIFLKYFTQNFK